MSDFVKKHACGQWHHWVIIGLLTVSLVWVVRAGDEKVAALSERFELEQKALVGELERVIDESDRRAESLENRVARVSEWFTANRDRLQEQMELGNTLDEVAPIERDATRTVLSKTSVGFANTSNSTSLTVGINNHIKGTKSTAIGEGLVINDGLEGAVVIGRYNKATGRAKDAIFVVGVGDEKERRNAIEIYPNGDVVLGKAQGDISMGPYGK